MHASIVQINTVFQKIAERDGIHGLKLTSDNATGLQLKTGENVFFEYVNAHDKIYIYTPLSPIPKDGPRRQALYENMLRCNFLGGRCGSGTLAIFLRTEEAVYQIGMDVKNLTVARLDGALKELIQQGKEALYQMQRPAVSDSAHAQSARPAQSTARRINRMY